MSLRPEDSILKVRRSIHVPARPDAVWASFESKPRMEAWWGKITGSPEAGTSQGQWLDVYDPRLGGQIRMAVMWDGARVSYGGAIKVFDGPNQLTFENDWIPSRGWDAPTHVTLRLTPVLEGTLVELFHHGFERTGGDVSASHAGYEEGWGMTQLKALKALFEGQD